MAVFVINEWLWSDLSGENDREAQAEAFVVVEKLPASEHQIVIIEGSQFDAKAWKLCRSDSSMLAQRIGGAFVKNVRENLGRCRVLKGEEVAALPEELASKIKDDDRYLVQAQLAVAGAILVTTDVPLREAVATAGLPCISREDFLVPISEFRPS